MQQFERLFATMKCEKSTLVINVKDVALACLIKVTICLVIFYMLIRFDYCFGVY